MPGLWDKNNSREDFLDILYNGSDWKDVRKYLKKYNVDLRKHPELSLTQLRHATIIALEHDDPTEYINLDPVATDCNQDYIAMLCCKNHNWDLYNALCKMCDAAPTENEKSAKWKIFKDYFDDFDYEFSGAGAELDLQFCNPEFSLDRIFDLLSAIGLFGDYKVLEDHPECLDPTKTSDEDVKKILDTHYLQSILHDLKSRFNIPDNT